MAEGTGKILTRIAINSAPPAIPTNPETKLVKKTDNRIAMYVIDKWRGLLEQQDNRRQYNSFLERMCLGND